MRRLLFFYVPLGYFEGNKWSKNVIQGLLLCIICLNFIILTIPTQDDSFLESDDIITQLLKSFGLEKNEKKSYQAIPVLSKDSNSVFFNNRFRLSSYYVPGWADTRFNFRKNITIDATKVSIDLTNFPVLVDLYDPDLKQEAQASGNDIMFTNASGHILDHEIESYRRVYNSTHAHLVTWVKTNLSGTQDTVISMYYGNSTALNQENPEDLWDGNYKMVQHFEETSGTHYDSTKNNNDGTTSGGVIQDFQGQINGADVFDGNDDKITVSADTSLDTTYLTASAWIYPTGQSSIHGYVVSDYDWTDVYHKRYFIYISLSSHQIRGRAYQSNTSYVDVSDTTSIGLNQWHHVQLVVDSDSIDLYLDGSQIDTEPFSGGLQQSNLVPINIGKEPEANPNAFNGTIDEVRISSIARSADWIATEYNNQYSPTSFYSLNTEERYSDTTEWQFPGFKYRKEININSGKVSGSSLSNFPVLIDFEDTDLHYPQAVQPDGDDILFCDASGAKLDHEIEFFDQVGNGTHARLVTWVRIPTLSGTTDTQIFMYFGNPTASSQESPSSVWDENYVGVWHLNEVTGGTDAIKDSTANDNHGTDYNNPAFGQTGKIHNAIAFDGTNQYIELPNSATLIDITEGDYTYEVWFYADQVPPGTGSDNDARYAAQIKSDPHGGCYYDNDRTFAFEHWLSGPTNTVAKTTTTYNPQSFYHVVGVVSKTSGYTKIYVNGTLEDTDTWTPGSNAHDYVTTLKFGIGNPGAAIYRWCLDGKLDEMRVSDISRSPNWIQTEYNNQNDPDTFYSVGSIEIRGDWALPQYLFKKNLSLNASKVSADLTDFPLLINLYDTDLHSTEKVQADGDDILFVDALGT
ncbi:MAG: DUF2341 domain-containing protein, partial [Candidatus Hodarchaeota archaeon]